MEHFIIMSHQQELKDVTTVITSILTAKKPPRGIPLVNLDQDYYEFESQRIPYRRLGFSSLVDFIKTIPEVEIYERGTSHFINFLGKNSTRHISDLVAKQRNPSFKNRSRSVNTRKTAPAMYRPRDSSSSSSSIDPKVTSYISSIIYNHPYGMKESELIQKLLHKRPYLTLSSYQCKEHLRILDREVVIRDDLIYPKNSSSIPRESSSFAARPSRSQSVAPKRHFNNNNNNNGHSNGEYYDRRSEETNGNYWGRSYDNHRYAEHNYSNTNGNYALNYQDNYGNAGNDRRENQSHQSSVLSNNFKVAGIDSDEHYEADDLGFDEETEYAGASAPAANGIQGYGDSNGYNYDYEVQDMQNGDSRHNGGNIVEQVPSYGNLDKFEDKKKVNFEADHRQLEFIGADDGAGAGDVAAAGDVAGAVVEVDRKEALFKKNKEYIAQTISKRTVLRLEKLLENNPNGIWCIDLPKLYTEDYKLTLEWEDFGFQRLSDFVSHLPKIFKMVGPYRNGDYRLFDARKPLPDDEFQRQQKPTMASLYNIYGDNDNDDALPKTISLETKQALCPDNVLGINETVGHISVTRFEPDIDANGEPSMKNIEVNVVEAFTPSFFWVQLARNKPKFEQMMEDLGNFYDENSLRYRIPPIVIERGLNIACQFFGKWHRGIIKSITPTGSRVTVMFYDFGTIKSYRPEEVYFLHRRFGVMDAQAIPCGLCYIQPRKRNSGSHDGQSNEWPKDARDQFLHMAFKCEMWATIVKVDVDNNSMQIGLTDTSGDEDLHIADYLIHKKFAEKSNTDLVINPSDLSLYVEDYGDNYTSDDPEEQPAVNLNSPTVYNMPAAQPSLENSNAVFSSSQISSISTQTAFNWDSFSEKITQVLEHYDQSVNGVYVSLAASDWESTAVKLIKNSLHKVYVKLMYDAIHPEASSATPSQILHHPTDYSAAANHSVSYTESDVTLTNGNQTANDVFAESLSVPDTKTLPDNINGDKPTPRVLLEDSIRRAGEKFFTNFPTKESQEEEYNSFVDDFNDTNPFKSVLVPTETQDSQVPPPLPPRSKKTEVYSGPAVTEVYSAPPVMYDIPEDDSVQTTSATEYLDDGYFEDEMASFYSKIEKVEPAVDSNAPVPVYNDIVLNPVAVDNEKKYPENWENNSCQPSDARVDHVNSSQITPADSFDNKDTSQSSNRESKVDDQSITDDGNKDKIIDTLNSAAFDNNSYRDEIIFNTVILSSGTMDIYYFDKTGWILIDQYRSAFTVYDDSKLILTIIKMKSTNIPIKEVTKISHPEIFEQFRKSEEKFYDDNNYDFEVLYLIPVNYVIKLSHKLHVVSKVEIEKVKNHDYDYQLSVAMSDIHRLISSNEHFINSLTQNYY
ncbi:uncharacterized protein LOC130668211 isoform X2 [Microplitis mediator]|uniref:uncharacterized protein LOC130668211 isoform X2 n=1 Tax=Microplitis mediator TaxID=375433 RepID=UPI00255696FF|nr:uncharacterized protein LOC130668211 isoform X2 [Microplitis mediator]